MINKEEKLANILKKNENTMNIIVNELSNVDDEDNEKNLKQSKDIICPICNEICLINLNDYKINFSDCKNGHKFINIMFDEFFDFQKIDESKIICDECEGEDKNKKSEVNNNKFYKCCICNINLCPLCKMKHDSKKHLIINYDIKNYVCNEHGGRYISYCKECMRQSCDSCKYDSTHYSKNHKVLYLFNMMKKENKMNELKIKIDDLTKKISNKTTIINKIIKNFEAYYNVANNIINNFDKRQVNYYSVKNINNIIEYNEKLIKDIDKILNENNDEIKNKYISDINKKMFINNEFTLKYKLGNVGILKIFGEPFVSKNKNNFILIIKGENYELSSIIKIIDIETGKTSNKIIKSKKNDEEEEIIKLINEKCEIKMKIEETLEIKLRQIKTVKDISYMFSGCTTLESIEASNWDTTDVTDMSYMFNECESLTSLPDISKWNTINVANMSNMFSGCKSLTSLPNISKRDN